MSITIAQNLKSGPARTSTVGHIRSIFASYPLLRNISAFAGAEVSNRITRIIAMVFVARTLTPEMFGVAASIIVAHELAKIATANGIGQMIVASSDEDLASTCERANSLNFLACICAAAFQIAAGWTLAVLLDTPVVLYMSLCLGVVFLGMPFGLVRLFRTARRNELHVMARINHRQITADNLLTLLFAIAGFGAWALVLPKALTMPIWLHGARKSDDWKSDSAVKPAAIRPFVTYCRPFLFTEALKACRTHLDKALVGSILGIEALGIYFFAVNAGLGFATTFSRLISDCLMPHICNAVRDGQDAFAAWRKTTPILLGAGTALFMLQAALAPLYVPIVFGEQWRAYGVIVALLCLAATPRLLSDCISQLARTTDNTGLEAKAMAFISSTSILALALGASGFGLIGAAIAMPLAAWIFEPVTAFWLYSKARKRQS